MINADNSIKSNKIWGLTNFLSGPFTLFNMKQRSIFLLTIKKLWILLQTTVNYWTINFLFKFLCKCHLTRSHRLLSEKPVHCEILPLELLVYMPQKLLKKNYRLLPLIWFHTRPSWLKLIAEDSTHTGYRTWRNLDWYVQEIYAIISGLYGNESLYSFDCWLIW